MSRSADTSGHDIFLRKTSGLVKAAGAFDVFVYNFGLISVGIAISLTHFNVPKNYPGASIPWSEILAAAFMAAIAWGFWCWSVAIPRSGGVYAYVSRSVSPGLGFAVSFVDTFTWLFYNALAATFLTTIGLGPGLFVAGHLTGTPALTRAALALQSPGAQMAVGAAAVVAAGVVLAAGMRVFFALQKWLLIMALGGTAAACWVLATADPATFRAHFEAAIGPYLAGVSRVVEATEPGTPAHFLWRPTVLAAVWPVLSYVGGIFSVNIGGEIRKSERSQMVGMFGSIAAAAAVMAGLSALGNRVFGVGFQAALRAYPVGSGQDFLPLPPYFSLLAALTTQSPLLAIVICLGFFAWAFFWLPATMVYASRAVIAWSFDRVAPAWLGYVHPRRNTPVAAVAVIAVANLVFLALYLFTPLFGGLVLVLAAMVAWIPTMLGAVIFPYSRPDLFSRGGMAGRKLIGLPLMSVAGTVALAAVITLTILLWNDPIAAGHSPESLGTIAAVFTTGFGLYLVAKTVRRRSGIAIEKAFAEIPIE